MKLSSMLIMLFLFQVTAIGYSQNSTVSIQADNITLEQLFVEIEKQSDVKFLYRYENIAGKSTQINADNVMISTLLSGVLSPVDLQFIQMDNNLIVVAPKESKQSIVITGVVTDPSGATMPGVNILIKGTFTGAVTDANGRYSITVPDQAAVLVFSFIGYTTQELIVGNQAIINVVLDEETELIEEIVVIGYGTVRKSDLTGSVGSVGVKDINKEPIQRMEQALQGRVSGVTITNTSGLPNGAVQIRVRGANSINGGNDPLYIVDGVANSDLFRILDVNDIQSIEVLKDASSTAIYGSRGANGVVLVTTKKGSQKKFEVQLETQQGWETVAKKYDMLSAVEFANFYNEYRKNNGATDDFYSSAQINEWKNNGGFDWQDMIFKTAHTQNYKLSVSGGTPQVRYLVSGNIRDAEGILINSNFKKYNLRANIDATTFDWLNINLEVNASHDKSAHTNKDITGRGGAIWTALTYSPTIGLIGEDGNWFKDNVSSWQDNPYGKRVQDGDDITSNYFGSNLRFSFDLPVKGLTFDILGSASYLGRDTYVLNSNEKLLRATNSATNASDEWVNLQNTNQLTYANKFGVHGITATVVAEFTQNSYNNLNLGVNTLLTESVGYWNLGLGTISGFGNNYSKNTLASYVGRLNYTLMDKYLFTATIRRDGSSKFQGDNKWGYFPSFALAWRVSDEPFIRNLNIFDQLKLRASWGVTGNQAIGAYSTLGLLVRSNYGWGTESTIYPGYWAQNSPTPDLTWEKTYQWDFGADFGFFNNRLTATVDFYSKNTKDLLLEKALPYYDGGGSVFRNLGHVKNQGVEISLSTVPVRTNQLSWESTVNFAWSKNKVIDLGGDERLNPSESSTVITLVGFSPYVLQVGKPMGSLWGYTWLGLWGTDEAEEAAKYGQKPGDNKFLDRNEDYQINVADQGIIGKAVPDYTFGWNNTVSWKKFEFNLFLQGAVGADRLNLTRYGMSEAISDARFPTSKEGYYDMWTPDNQDTKIPNIYSTSIKTNAGSTQYLESADYVRIKNFSIGYNVPVKKGIISGIQISASIQNLFTLTDYSGYDPEITSSGTNDTRAGIEEGAYPLPRTYTVGLRVNF